MLDLIYCTQKLFQQDLEGSLILLYVADATMRPLVLNTNLPPEVRHAQHPRDDDRGFTTRRSIAEKTGLPRETVRRRITALLAAGRVQEDAGGRIRAVQALGEAHVQDALDQVRYSVTRFINATR